MGATQTAPIIVSNEDDPGSRLGPLSAFYASRLQETIPWSRLHTRLYLYVDSRGRITSGCASYRCCLRFCGRAEA